MWQKLFTDRLHGLRRRKEIELCLSTLHRTGDEIPAPWRAAIAFVNHARRWMCLPFLSISIDILISAAPDTLSIVLNTLAALFLLEMDNAIYTFGLSSHDKNKVGLGLNTAQDEFENTMKGGHTRAQLLQLVRCCASPQRQQPMLDDV